MTPDRPGDEQGSVAVVLAALLAALLLVVTGVGTVARVAAARAAAAAAADLSALAAAHAGSCMDADEVAVANGASLVTCRIVDRDAVVTAVVAVPVVAGRTLRVTARARAGPAPD